MPLPLEPSLAARRACLGLIGVLFCGTSLAQGVWDPRALTPSPDPAAVARDPRLLRGLIEDGRRIFLARFNALDGVGRPAATGEAKPTRRLDLGGNAFDRSTGPDATSCVSCHGQGGPGGGGDFSASVIVASTTGYVAATPDHGSRIAVRRPPSLFGAGLIEALAREMTDALRAQRDSGLAAARASGQSRRVALATKGVDFGSLEARPDGTYDASAVSGVGPDLVVRPFGWRGQAASIREFTITALNQHHGLEAVERFGWERTGRRDFDEDGTSTEVTPGQVTALVMFLASLPPLEPRRLASHGDPAIARGESAFASIGCTACHRPALPLEEPVFVEPGPYRPPGTLSQDDVAWRLRLPLALAPNTAARAHPSPLPVRAFTDLKWHRICDAEDAFLCDELSLRDGRPADAFLTAKLWALGIGPPYSHRGDCSTLSEVIRHHSGEAAPARRAFLALADEDKRAVVAFLLSLGFVDPAAATASPGAGAR